MSAPDFRQRLQQLLPAAWFGLLAGMAAIGTPAPFAVLDRHMAGMVVAPMFAREAPTSLAFGALLLMLARRAAADRAEAGRGSLFSVDMGLALATLACTIVGYYVLQPLMAAARAGEPTALSFGALHGVSFGLFGLKMLLVAALAWRGGRG